MSELGIGPSRSRLKSRAATLALLPVLGAAAPALADGSSLGLRDVLVRVRAHNVAVRSARNAVDIAGLQVDRAWTAWQPSLTAVGQLQFNSVEAAIDGKAQALGLVATLGNAFMFPADTIQGALDTINAGPDQRTVISPHVALSGVLQLNQLLFNINAIRSPGAAKRAREAADATVLATDDELSYNAAQIFITINGLRALQAAAERASQVAERRIQDARTQLEAGTATKLIVTRAETEKATADGQILSLRAQQAGLLASLKGLMGAPGENLTVSADPLEKQIELQIPAAPETRSKVVAREAYVRAVEAQLGLTEQQWLPTLSADGSMRYTNFQGFAGTNVVFQGNLTLSIPLYDQGVRYVEQNIAEANLISAKLSLESEIQAAQVALIDAETKLESARAELTQAEAQLRLAVEAVEQSESLVKNGLGTNLELTDADGKRFQADQTVVQKKFEVENATIRLIYARGSRLLALGAK